MANSLSISSAADQARVFECPNCNETINTSLKQCTFCSTPIDIGAAELAAEAMAKVNQACSDGSYIGTMSFATAGFYLLTYLPIVSLLGYVGLVFLFFAVPVMSIRWRTKFGAIESSDPDLQRARKTVTWAGILVPVLIIVGIAPFVFLHWLNS